MTLEEYFREAEERCAAGDWADFALYRDDRGWACEICMGGAKPGAICPDELPTPEDALHHSFTRAAAEFQPLLRP